MSTTHERETRVTPPAVATLPVAAPPAMWAADQFDAGPQPRMSLRLLHEKFLGLFVVSSSTGTSYGYLDGVRSIAVMLIIAFHSWILSGAPGVDVTFPLIEHTENMTIFLATSFIGINLFFVLSGFLLAQSWMRADQQGKPRPSTRRYFRMRFLRIVPAYYVCLFLMLLFLTPSLISPDQVYSGTGLFILGAHLLFMQDLFPISSSSYIINGPLWTLTMEMIFYLILPWLVVAFLRNRWVISLPICIGVSLGWLYLARHALGPVVRFWQAQSGLDEVTLRYFLSQQFPAHLATFAFGIALANINCRYRQREEQSRLFRTLTAPWLGNLYFVVGVAIVIWGMERFRHPNVLWHRYYGWGLTFAIGFTLLIAGLFMGWGVLRTLFGITPLRFIGIVGYSAYLWHMPLIYVFNKLPAIIALPPEDRLKRVVIAVAIALTILSALSYLLIEKPFLLLGRRQEATKGSAVAVHAAEHALHMPPAPLATAARPAPSPQTAAASDG